jgi:hypothetical protein
LKRESRREAVIRLIEEALLNGDLQPGDRIVEPGWPGGDEVVEQIRNWPKE